MTCSLAENVAAEIRAEMGRQRKSHEDLAQVLGIARSAVTVRLLGQRPFKLAEVERLAEYFGVPLSSLIRERAVA